MKTQAVLFDDFFKCKCIKVRPVEIYKKKTKKASDKSVFATKHKTLAIEKSFSMFLFLCLTHL